jgi:hypothetical protein
MNWFDAAELPPPEACTPDLAEAVSNVVLVRTSGGECLGFYDYLYRAWLDMRCDPLNVNQWRELLPQEEDDAVNS